MKKDNWILTVLLFGFIYSESVTPLLAQHWQAEVRDSGVDNDSSQNVSIILIADSISADIIVPSNSHSSIKQAAKFLASDIEKLTRHGPQISREPKAGKT